MNIRKLTTMAMLTAISMIVFLIEAQIPLPIAIPGVKLGIANVITLFADVYKRQGLVNIRLDLHDDIAGRDVLLVEDILDTGNTLSKLVAELKGRHPASLKLCVLLDKPERRTRPLEADYVGFTIPDAFVVGCGLDYDQKYRQLPYIGVLKPSVYE